MPIVWVLKETGVRNSRLVCAGVRTRFCDVGVALTRYVTCPYGLGLFSSTIFGQSLSRLTLSLSESVLETHLACPNKGSLPLRIARRGKTKESVLHSLVSDDTPSLYSILTYLSEDILSIM